MCHSLPVADDGESMLSAGSKASFFNCSLTFSTSKELTGSDGLGPYHHTTRPLLVRPSAAAVWPRHMATDIGDVTQAD